MNQSFYKRYGLFFLVIIQVIFISVISTSMAKAKSEKMNVAPNYSFENDLTKTQTNLCNFGGWFPIGVVTEDGSSEIKIVEDISKNMTVTVKIPEQCSGIECFPEWNDFFCIE